MIDSFARRTGLIAIGQSGVKATQLIVAVLLVRMLSPAQWAETAYLLSIYLAALTIGTLNLHHGILFFVPRVGPTARRALVYADRALTGRHRHDDRGRPCSRGTSAVGWTGRRVRVPRFVARPVEGHTHRRFLSTTGRRWLCTHVGPS